MTSVRSDHLCCDLCGSWFTTALAPGSIEEQRETAKDQGWLVRYGKRVNLGRDVCPTCQEDPPS